MVSTVGRATGDQERPAWDSAAWDSTVRESTARESTARESTARDSAVRKRLGRLIVVTDARQASAPLAEVVAAAIGGGARTVLLREKQLPRPERFALATRLREMLERVGGLLIVAGPDGLGGSAVHLAGGDRALAGPVAAAGPGLGAGLTFGAGPGLAAGSGQGVVRPHITDVVTTTSMMWALRGRSCHRPEELVGLAEDYAFLSPVFATPSKPGYGPPLGLDLLRKSCASSGRPVYALGGVRTAEQAAACVDSGSAGVAVMGEIMRAADPAVVVTELLAGLAEVPA